MTFTGRDDHITRIVSAYQPCHTSTVSHQKSSREPLETVYMQHKEYFRQRGSQICPRKAMVRDLGAFLKKCKANGERLVLFIDANEGMTNGHMQHMLSSEDLGMREAAMSCHPSLPKMLTYMHQPGKNPIDGCWLTTTFLLYLWDGWQSINARKTTES